jgi:hypothetical protein
LTTLIERYVVTCSVFFNPWDGGMRGIVLMLNSEAVGMEKIVTHYAGNSPLDLESLEAMAEAVDNRNPDVAHIHRQAPVMGSLGSDCLGVDDDIYTVQPLGNNVTCEAHRCLRQFFLSGGSANLVLKTIRVSSPIETSRCE